MDYSPPILNEIRRLLQESEEWMSAIATDDSAMIVRAYIAVIRRMIQERKRNVTQLHKRRQFLTTFTYTAGFIGGGSAIGASALYAVNRSKGETSDAKNLFSLVLSIMTGTFVFVAGCGQLISDYKRYDKRALKQADEASLLEILCRTVTNSTNMTANDFLAIEEDIFGKDDVTRS